MNNYSNILMAGIACASLAGCERSIVGPSGPESGKASYGVIWQGNGELTDKIYSNNLPPSAPVFDIVEMENDTRVFVYVDGIGQKCFPGTETDTFSANGAVNMGNGLFGTDRLQLFLDLDLIIMGWNLGKV